MQAARGTPLSEAGAADPASASLAPRRVGWFVVTVALGYLLDVATKVIAVDRLADRGPVTVIPGVLELDLVRNPGAAFGMATGLTLALTLVACVVVVYVIRLAGRLRSRTWALGLGLLLAGALGNLTDRVFRSPGPLRGHVVDFFHLVFVDFPLFNIADACITIAAGIIVVQSVRGVAIDGRSHA